MNIFLNISNKLNIMFSSLFGNEGGSPQVNCESKCYSHTKFTVYYQMMLEIKQTLSKNFSKTKAKNCLTVIIIIILSRNKY